MRRVVPIAAVWLAAAVPAPAQAADAADAQTVLHLTQTAERRVTRDVLHVDLKSEATAADPQAVQAAINQAMTRALAQARQVSGVTVATGSYSVYRQGGQGEPAKWTGSQSLLLTGTDSAGLLKLAGALQSGGLAMANLGYEISPEAVRAAEDDLTAEALSALDRRAAAIAGQLHRAVLFDRDVTVGNAQTAGGPMPRYAMTAAAAMPAPVAAPGEDMVRVTVNADIVLGPKPP